MRIQIEFIANIVKNFRVPLVVGDVISTLVTLYCLSINAAWAQSEPVPSPAATKAVKSAASPLEAIASDPSWNDLSAAQKQVLLPLAATWNSLGGERKGKWLAVSRNYANIGPAEQEKLQSRMAEWAALKPREREQARLNFAETKKLAPTEKAANWEAYQALSPEEKQKLAANAPAKPTGAALAVKPVAPDKLAPVPLTRLTPLHKGATPEVPKP